MVVRERNLKAGFPQFSLSPGNYLGLPRSQPHLHRHRRVRRPGASTWPAEPNPSGCAAPRVTIDFFDVLGRKPALGRTLHRAGNATGPDQVAILSYGLWQRRFAGSRDVLGQTMKLNDELYTVIGVMPPDFQFPGRVEIWTPLAMNLQNWQQRGGHYLGGIGRLKPGAHPRRRAGRPQRHRGARGAAVSRIPTPAGIPRSAACRKPPWAAFARRC